MFRQKIFKEFCVLALVVGILNFLALDQDLYWRWLWFDSLMHFLGGALVASFFLWLYFFSGFLAPEERELKSFAKISLLAIVLVGVSWEIYELLLGESRLHGEEYISDTTLDIVMDLLGALVACLYAYSKELDLVNPKIESNVRS